MSSEPAAQETQASDARLNAFRPLRPKNLAQSVVVVIVDAIRGGLYEPGEKLPPSRELASALEVSGAVVREATGILERAHIVSVKRGAQGGTFVETRWIPREVIAEIEGETYQSMKSLLEVRRVLETPAALLAGQRRTDEDINALQALVDKLPALVDQGEEFLAVDIQFHVRLAEASQNERLARLVRETMSQFISDRSEYPVGHIDIERALYHQRDTLGAIIDGTPARIEQSIDEHLGSAEEYFLGERLSDPWASVDRSGQAEL
jgi:GntR family transcriptional regulator, transcriptional repressor for pyruvate dehydrogenase complex